jgi:2-keto-4-pentenoate hydratase
MLRGGVEEERWSGRVWPSPVGRLVNVNDEVVGDAARELLDMRASRRVVPDLPRALRPQTLTEAYAIQHRVVAALVAQAGGRCIGFKVACTSEIAQAALQIDRPVFGRLMSQSTSPSETPLAADQFTIEIVDYRFESWAVGALRIAADNAIHGWWLRGEPVTDWHGHDLAAATVSVTRDGELITTGSGAAVLGHPLNVMAWLADELPRFGLGLRRGDVVTTGVATDVFEAGARDTCVADFGPFGEVTVAFN